ncbi:MAG: hypothetical protein WKF71_00495 [Pyrinomonadaceae bacterium]
MELLSGAATEMQAAELRLFLPPQDDVRVLLDPDGHPFCLYLSD